MEGGRRRGRTGWWKNVVDSVDGVDGRWFWDNVDVKIGDGKESNFWEGMWSGDRSLKDMFPRLYQLNKNKSGKVEEFGEWVEGEWAWRVVWRRELRSNEKEWERGLLSWLQRFKVERDLKDRWEWKGGGSRDFTVKAAYKVLSAIGNDIAACNPWNRLLVRVWRSMAPYKVQVFTWRLLRNRIPTKENLIRRNLIDVRERRCCCCNTDMVTESASHLFLQCVEVEKIWCRMVRWIGSCWAMPKEIQTHWWIFSNLLGGGINCRRLSGLWSCVTWVLWKWRNAVLFEGGVWDFTRIEVEIKCRFWSWGMVRGDVDSNMVFSNWENYRLCDLWM